ncbi:MAG: alpha/beta hydrolase [Pseudomonadota bacterium]|nr:alpha/beta hydrolase [Pseudomonadota bacterium]
MSIPSATEYVILLHGLARSANSMNKIAKALETSGYLTINVNYSSTQYQVEKLAEEVITKALAACPKEAKINFVTHSMGGILVRQFLSNNVVKNMGRVVMLGPPNKGSQLADKLGKIPGFKLVNGPAGIQLGTTKQSVPNSLGPVDFELGIIAGTRSINPILSLMIPKPNDGKVSVDSSKVAGMIDHIELPVTHSFMMTNETVIAQVIYFLTHGLFKMQAN